MNTLRMTILFVFWFLKGCKGAGSCRSGYKEDGTKCYKYFATPVSWDQANKTCKADNSSLIKMEELNVFKLVHVILRAKGRHIWVGARRQPSSKIIQWLDGDNVSRFWTTGHPTNDQYDCVAATNFIYGASLNDRPCEQKLSFVCEGECRSDYTIYRNICYKYFADAVSWEAAVRQCKGDNSTLIKIDTSDTLLLLEFILIKNVVSSIWVGARRTSNSMEFQWINGANVSQFWKIGEPNNHNGIEDCVDFVMGTPGFLTEVQCTYEFPFLCEVAQEASEQLTTPVVSSQGTPRDISDLVTETSAQLTTQGAKNKGTPEDKSDRTLLAVKIAVPSVVSGLLCGAVTAVVCTYLMRRKRQIRANVQLHFGARYVRRKPTGDPANVVNTSTQNIEDSNINPAILDHIPDLNRDVDIPSVHVDPYHELEDGDTYDSIAESGLQLNRALPPLPDGMGGSLRGSVDEGDVEEEKGGYCIGRVGHCKEECNDGTE